MGPKLSQEFYSPDTAEILASYPALPRRIRLLDNLVRKFPRRVFKPFIALKLFKPKREDKFISHALHFSKALTEADRLTDPGPYQLGIADADIIARIIAHREAFPPEAYYSRLHRGDACYYLAHEGELKCLQWVNFRECALVWDNDHTLNFRTLPNDEAYLYDFYTYSDCRGQGYGSKLKRFVWGDLYGKNFASCCNAIHHDNFVSLKVHLKGGFKLHGLLYMYQLMSWQGVFHGTRAETRAVENWLNSLGWTPEQPGGQTSHQDKA